MQIRVGSDEGLCKVVNWVRVTQWGSLKKVGFKWSGNEIMREYIATAFPMDCMPIHVGRSEGVRDHVADTSPEQVLSPKESQALTENVCSSCPLEIDDPSPLTLVLTLWSSRRDSTVPKRTIDANFRSSIFPWSIESHCWRTYRWCRVNGKGWHQIRQILKYENCWIAQPPCGRYRSGCLNCQIKASTWDIWWRRSIIVMRVVYSSQMEINPVGFWWSQDTKGTSD